MNVTKRTGLIKELLEFQTIALLIFLLLIVLAIVKHEQVTLWLFEQQTGVHVTHREFVEAKAKVLDRCTTGIELAGNCVVIGPKGMPIPVGKSKQ